MTENFYSERMDMGKGFDGVELLTPGQVADMLQVKLSTIYAWTHQREIPHFKVGRLVRFTRAGVEDWLRAKQREPQKVDLPV